MRKRFSTGDLCGTMRLGAYKAAFKKGTKIAELNGSSDISERHRHRHELYVDYKEHLEACGLVFCRLLPIAPSTYYEVIAKRTDEDRLSTCARRNIAIKVEIRRVFNEKFQVDGVRKVWRQLQRKGYDIARCTVARLMSAMELQGIIRANRSARRSVTKPRHIRSIG